MANPETARLGTDSTPGTYVLRPGTLASAAVAVCLAQVALAIPAVLNGMFTTDLGPTSAQLTWITDAFLVPVCLLELTFGVLGDLFGRKRLLIIGAVVLAVGEAIAVATPGAGSSTSTRVLVLWIGQIIAGVGAAALFPTSLAMIAAGTHTARRRAASVSVPFILAGAGFALAVSSVTAVAVNTVPNHLAGMASGSTNMLRDFGFTLGPAIVGAVALSQAAARITSTLAGSPALRAALAGFSAAPAHVPAAQRPSVAAAVGAVNSGPLGANAVPATVTGPGGKPVPFNPLQSVAFHALSHGYALGYLICGIAALAAALLTLVAVHGRVHETLLDPRTLADD